MISTNIDIIQQRVIIYHVGYNVDIFQKLLFHYLLHYHSNVKCFNAFEKSLMLTRAAFI